MYNKPFVGVPSETVRRSNVKEKKTIY